MTTLKVDKLNIEVNLHLIHGSTFDQPVIDCKLYQDLNGGNISALIRLIVARQEDVSYFGVDGGSEKQIANIQTVANFLP